MPLLKNILVNELRKFIDPEYFEWVEYPQGLEAAKEALANAVYEYSKDVIPASLPAASQGAKSAMITALEGMEESEGGVDVIKAALNTYAGLLGTGMSSGGFVQLIPPPSPVLPPLQNIELEDGKTSEQAANEFADIVHDWFIAWKATNPAIPVTQNWS